MSHVVPARRGRPALVPLALGVLLLGVLTAGTGGNAGAQLEGLRTPDRPLRVAVKPAPPFVIETSDGQFEGIAIELWRDIEARQSLESELSAVSLEELLLGVEEGRFDVGIGALTVTAERERRIDFSHPFHSSGLGIAAREGGSVWVAVLSGLLSRDFLRAAIGLSLLLLAVGALVWWFERRHNDEDFDARVGPGLGSGFWFAAVTMTTVGYGDKAPRSLGGRIVSFVWMFAAIIVISFFTAGLASSLTVNSLRAAVEGPEDLGRARVGTIDGTTSAQYLHSRGIDFTDHATVARLVAALESGSIEAAVYDAPILRWMLHSRGTDDLIMLPGTFERQEYAFALAENSPWRERLNRALLEECETPAFRRLLDDYLGD